NWTEADIWQYIRQESIPIVPLYFAHDHGTFSGEIQRHDWNTLLANVLPDIGFGPVGKWKYPYGFARVDAGIVEIPQFWALGFRLPAMAGCAKRKNPFLGAGFFLITPCAPEDHVKPVKIQSLLQCFRLHDIGVVCGAVGDWPDTL